MAAELGSERLCCNHMRQFLYLDWCLNFGKCDERHCARLTLSSLDTQTIAMDVHVQELVANKRLTMKHFWRHANWSGQGAFCPVFLSFLVPKCQHSLQETY